MAKIPINISKEDFIKGIQTRAYHLSEIESLKKKPRKVAVNIPPEPDDDVIDAALQNAAKEEAPE